MKKIYVIIIALIISASAANAQTGWVNHVGDNRISLKFPSEPAETEPGSGSFVATDKDGIAYILTIVDFVKVAGIDSVALAPMKTTPEFAAQIKTGMTSSLPGVDLADFTIGTWKGFTSYRTTGSDAKKRQYDMFMFIIGNKLYSVSTVRADGVGIENRDVFFNSVQVSN